MRLKAFRARVGPAREIDHDAQVAVVSGLDGLHDVEAAAVEEVRVIAEQTFELRYHRVFRRNGLGIQFRSVQRVQGLLDLCGIHLHRTHSSGWRLRTGRGVGRSAPPTRKWSKADDDLARSARR